MYSGQMNRHCRSIRRPDEQSRDGTEKRMKQFSRVALIALVVSSFLEQA